MKNKLFLAKIKLAFKNNTAGHSQLRDLNACADRLITRK
jgi:hypothetical protein